MDELLSVRDLHVSFSTESGVARVLDGVNFSIGKGEVVGLVGESGCGKTTLARAILGILPASSARIDGGSIRFKGEELLNKDARTLNDTVRGRAITFIPQDPYSSFNPVFTVGAQIMELLRWKSPRLREGEAAGSGPDGRWARWLRRYPRRRYRADLEAALELMREVQIPQARQALRKLPQDFSGGQRQRLMIAMALLPRPDLIIADEPTTALDVTIQAQVLRLLRQLVKERNISVLFTTHDMGTAHEICDRITVMYAGQEVEDAPTDRFFRHPSHPYTKRLLESLPNPQGEIRDIAGELPELIAAPAGCRFHPRCDFSSEECSRARPDERALEPNHRVRCYHPIQWNG